MIRANIALSDVRSPADVGGVGITPGLSEPGEAVGVSVERGPLKNGNASTEDGGGEERSSSTLDAE